MAQPCRMIAPYRTVMAVRLRSAPLNDKPMKHATFAIAAILLAATANAQDLPKAGAYRITCSTPFGDNYDIVRVDSLGQYSRIFYNEYVMPYRLRWRSGVGYTLDGKPAAVRTLPNGGWCICPKEGDYILYLNATDTKWVKHIEQAKIND